METHYRSQITRLGGDLRESMAGFVHGGEGGEKSVGEWRDAAESAGEALMEAEARVLKLAAQVCKQL